MIRSNPAGDGVIRAISTNTKNYCERHHLEEPGRYRIRRAIRRLPCPLPAEILSGSDIHAPAEAPSRRNLEIVERVGEEEFLYRPARSFNKLSYALGAQPT